MFPEIPTNIVSDSIDGDTIVINITSGAYYSLTPLGAKIWNLVQVRADGLLDSHPNSLNTLAAEGLLTLDGAPLDGEPTEAADLFVKYVDMQDLLLADPIHEVGPDGWPKLL